MRLVTYDDGKVGYTDGDEIVRLDVPTMRDWFERGGADETGERTPIVDATLRAPIVPKKFFHTAGNFREHEEESKNVNWTHRIAPWINFFQNVDAIIGPDEPIVGLVRDFPQLQWAIAASPGDIVREKLAGINAFGLVAFPCPTQVD